MTEGFESGRSHDLRRLVELAPAMLSYWDRDLRCSFASSSFARRFGVDPREVRGRTLVAFIGLEALASLQAPIARVMSGQACTIELNEGLVPGSQVHTVWSWVPELVKGNVLGAVLQLTDVTRLKQTEAALRAGEQRFRAFSESAPFGVYHSDAQGRRSYTNRRWQEIFALAPEAGLGYGWLEAVHPQDRDRVLACWTERATSGAEFELEYRVRRAAGDVRIVHSRATPVRSDDGAVSGFVGADEDVTRQRDAEQRLRANEAFLDRTGRIAAVGGWQMDLRSGVIDWSPQIRRLHEVGVGYEPRLEQVLDFYAPHVRSTISAAVQKAIRQGIPWDLELPFVTANGRPLWVRSIGEVEREDGVPARLLGAIQDVTEHRQRALDLAREQSLRMDTERQVEDLDALLRERNEMLDVLAHEVRQPLNNASAALQSAANAVSALDDPSALRRVVRAQTVMSNVLASIDNTLAVASLLAHSQTVQREDTDIDMLVAVAIADMPTHERARVRIERLTTTRTAAVDMNLMRLALRNLLANALKFSAPGSPVALRVADSDDPLALLIDVVDQGEGVDPSLVPRLFERGVRGQRGHGPMGHGLGLYIVRRVMELQSGRALLADNAPGNVTFRLMIEPVPDN